MDKRVKGSFTLEASFLMIIILFVILTLIYMCFILYDTTYIQAISYKEINRSLLLLKHPVIQEGDVFVLDYDNITSGIIEGVLSKNDGEREVVIEKNFLRSSENALAFCKIINTDIEIAKEYLSKTTLIESQIQIPIFKVNKYNKEVSCKVKKHEPEKFIRKVNLLLKLVNK